MTLQQPLLLMTPGPTRLPERVLRAGAQPMIHHRTPEFSEALHSALDGLQVVFGTKADILPIHSTGRGAMEAAICNLFSPRDEVVACCNGKFGEMWARFAESYGVVVHRICRDWGQSVDPGVVQAALEKRPEVRAVTVVHCDTSTGVLNDVAAVCEIAQQHGVLSMIDGISAVGGVPFHFDRWKADVAITASQKCLMCSPGLAFVVLSEGAWSASDRATLPRHYWDFQAVRETTTAGSPETPGTAPVHLFLQVREALELILEERLGNVFARHDTMARAVRDWAAAWKLSPQCPELKQFSPTLAAVSTPPGMSPESIQTKMRERGILIARGVGRYRNSAFRIGHMGDIRPSDVQRTLDALGDVLTELRSETPVTVTGD